MHMLSRQVIPRAVQAGETRNTGVGVGSQRKGWTEKSILETRIWTREPASPCHMLQMTLAKATSLTGPQFPQP